MSLPLDNSCGDSNRLALAKLLANRRLPTKAAFGEMNSTKTIQNVFGEPFSDLLRLLRFQIVVYISVQSAKVIFEDEIKS